MSVAGQVWLPGILTAIGAQRDGSRARRAAFVCWMCVPVYLLFSFWALGGWFIAVEDPTLDGKVLSYATLYGFIMTFAWIAAAVFGLQLDHLNRSGSVYTALVLVAYAASTALTCYLVGTLNIISGLVMMGAPLLGMMLFPMREILSLFSLAIVAVLGASVASALGHIPYAPILNAGLVTTSAPGLYYAMSGIVGSALYVTYEVLIMAALVAASRYRETDAATLAITDALTGLANRRQILGELERLLLPAAKNAAPCAIVLVELDDFRGLGERHGHRAADLALIAAAHALRGALRNRDLVGRFHGSEFLVVLPDTQATAAHEVGQRCQNAVKNCMANTGGDQISLSASTGVAARSAGEHLGIDDLLRAASISLAANRAAGNVKQGT
jgi:diguanylate cyclase (GGDEF)-like protein